MASKSHKRAHEYAAAQNINAWTLHHDGRCVGRIVVAHYSSGCTASVYRYIGTDSALWLTDDDDHVVSARGTYTNETIEAAVRYALRGHGVFTTYNDADPYHGRQWRDILTNYEIHAYEAI